MMKKMKFKLRFEKRHNKDVKSMVGVFRMNGTVESSS